MVFKKIFKTKSDSNINQKSLNYPIFTNFLGGACPQLPKQKAWPCPAAQHINCFDTCKFTFGMHVDLQIKSAIK